MVEREGSTPPEAGRVTFHSPGYHFRAGRQQTGSGRSLPIRGFVKEPDINVNAEPGSTPDVHRSSPLSEQGREDSDNREGRPRSEAISADDNEGTTGPDRTQVEASVPIVGETASERVPEEDDEPTRDEVDTTGTPDADLVEQGDITGQVPGDQEETHSGLGTHPALCVGTQGFVYHPWAEMGPTAD